ncbi:PorP/SprF family type IX secretion system membrane protein [Marinoscillum sp. MHG1-6]|uniref:PorP/SprF family type IX secretion system membrane protein n=1 Tax=Marinoscillum sp. MHG1-6 TaxID=2959627 RepID=UPI0021570872|nr:PorP/SprF family type IX secretion system membrane protein [Marinoscillum sp. MHG1-6]
MRFKLLIISLLFFLQGLQVSGQELQFSQYFSTSLYLNPAFSAIYVEPSFFVNFRKSLGNNSVLNETNQVSATFPILINKVDNLPQAGFGMMAYQNRSGFQGIFDLSGLLFNYAHNISIGALNAEVIAIGIQTGYEFYRSNYDQLQWGSNYNPYYGFDDQQPVPVDEFNTTSNHLIVNAGAMYYYNRERNFTLYNYSAFSGFSVTNLNQPYKSFSRLERSRAPMLYKYHGGIEFKRRKFNILPNILLQYQRRNYNFDGGLYAWYSLRENTFGTGKDIKVVAGTWYRLRDSYIFLIGINYNAFSMKVSYDLNSTLFSDDQVRYSNNHVELSMQYTISKERRIRKISNPLF